MLQWFFYAEAGIVSNLSLNLAQKLTSLRGHKKIAV